MPIYNAKFAGTVEVPEPSASNHAASKGYADNLSLGATNSASVWKNALTYGAVGDNSADDTTALQAWLDDLGIDEMGFLPPRRYRTTAPLRIKAGTRIYATQRRRPREAYDGKTSIGDGAYISPRSTFAGSAVIEIVDGRTAGLTTMTQGVIIDGINLNCGALPVGSTVRALQVYGSVQGVTIENLSIRGAPVGIETARNPLVASGPVAPFSLRMHRVFIIGSGTAVSTNGLICYNLTDAYLHDVQVIGISGDGFTLQGGGNSVLAFCRVENSTGRGFVFDQTSGGSKASATLVGCSTNLNTMSSVSVANALNVRIVDHVSNDTITSGAAYDIASSTGRVALVNCEARFGEGATSQYGLRVANTAFCQVDGGSYWGDTDGILDNGGNTDLRISRDTVELSGSTPTYVPQQAANILTSQTVTGNTTLSASSADVIEVNSASAVTITLPTGMAGRSVEVYQMGAGQVTVQAGSGVTLRTAAGSAGLKTAGQYGSVFARARSSTEWVAGGGVA